MTPVAPVAPAAPGGPIILAPQVYSPPVYVVPPVIVHPPVYNAGAPAPTASAAPPPAPAAPAVAPAAAVEPVPASPAATPSMLTDEAAAALSEAETASASLLYAGTGRRIDLAARPSTVITRSALLGSGLTNVGEVVQRIPSQGNGINAQANNGGDGTTRINLRGLGAARTTTLINGRTVAPSGTGADASYDLGLIPMAMVERIEVIKDGDAASFGSGAIGGAVNIVTRQRFDGTEASLYVGSSPRGDGNRAEASIATGVASSKGHITFAASYRKQEPVFAGDREWSAFDETFDYELREVANSGSPSTPQGFINTRLFDLDNDGRPDGVPVNLCGLEPSGTPIQFCTREGLGFRPFLAPADFYNYQPENYLITPSQRVSTFANGARELRPGLAAFFEAAYTRSETDQRLAPEPFSAARAPISGLSVYNPLGFGVHGYNRRLVEFGPRTAAQETDAFRVVAGLKGELDRGSLDGWDWELSYNLGRSSTTHTTDGNIVVSRMARALGPSYFDFNGIARCGTPSAPIAGCVPLNLLAGADAQAVTPEMIDYVKHRGTSSGFNQHQTALASLGGDLGDSLSVRVSASHRRETAGFTPDALTASGDTTANAQAPIDGSVGVSEAWAEASFAPLGNRDGRRLLQIDASARAFRYEQAGDGVAWKLAAILRPFGGLALRATAARSFRAPSILELFSEAADSFPPAIDPCDTTPPNLPIGAPPIVLPPHIAAECARQGVPAGASFGTSQQRSRIGGNLGVQAETADVVTAGVVLEARSGLTLSADYFRTEVKDAIQSRGANAILAACFQLGLREACDKIHREPALGGSIDFIDDTLTNVGGNTTSGLDLAASYQHARGKSRFSHLAEATLLDTFLIDNTLRVFEAKGNYDFGMYPDVKINLSSQWEYENLGFGANLRFISSFDECANLDCNSLDDALDSGEIGASAGTTDEDDQFRREVESVTTVDLFGSYKLRNRGGVMTVSFGVNNVFDQEPGEIYQGFYADSDPDYDFMGRFFYARVTQEF